MEKVYVTNDLAEFLNLNPNEPYKESELKKKIKANKLSPQVVSQKFPNYQMCYCGNCPVSVNQFLGFIQKNCVIKTLVPTEFCYEYNQKPIKLTKLNLEV